jgi:hypothetical protein
MDRRSLPQNQSGCEGGSEHLPRTPSKTHQQESEQRLSAFGGMTAALNKLPSVAVALNKLPSVAVTLSKLLSVAVTLSKLLSVAVALSRLLSDRDHVSSKREHERATLTQRERERQRDVSVSVSETQRHQFAISICGWEWRFIVLGVELLSVPSECEGALSSSAPNTHRHLTITPQKQGLPTTSPTRVCRAPPPRAASQRRRRGGREKIGAAGDG